jgi:hypothetical protein
VGAAVVVGTTVVVGAGAVVVSRSDVVGVTVVVELVGAVTAFFSHAAIVIVRASAMQHVASFLAAIGSLRRGSEDDANGVIGPHRSTLSDGPATDEFKLTEARADNCRDGG